MESDIVLRSLQGILVASTEVGTSVMGVRVHLELLVRVFPAEGVQVQITLLYWRQNKLLLLLLIDVSLFSNDLSQFLLLRMHCHALPRIIKIVLIDILENSIPLVNGAAIIFLASSSPHPFNTLFIILNHGGFTLVISELILDSFTLV